MNDIEKAIKYMKDAANIAEKNNLKQEVYEETKTIINTAISALENKTPKKPNKKEKDMYSIESEKFLCSICKNRVGERDEVGIFGGEYCSNCGQKIDWSEVENE